MLVSAMRTRLLAVVKRGLNQSFTAAEADYALQGALQDLDLTGRVNRQESSFSFTLGKSYVDLSAITGLRPDRVRRVELAYTDRGNWSSAGVSYAVNDLVFNDNRYFVCTVANTSSTSNEPGTDGGNNYWVGRNWARGDEVEVFDYASVARYLGDSQSPPPFRNEYVIDQNGQGKPVMIGALTATDWYCYPPPDLSYPGVIVMENPIDEWVAGVGDPDIDLPAAVLFSVIDVGAAAKLDPENQQAKVWAAQWPALKDRIRSKLIITTGQMLKDETAFNDIWEDWCTYGRRL